MRQLCSECGQPVSMRADRAGDRVLNEAGMWDHAACANPTGQDELLRSIFGRPRPRGLADEIGRNIGHVVTAAPRGWRCSCGMTGSAEPLSDKSAQRESGREHIRNAYIYG